MSYQKISLFFCLLSCLALSGCQKEALEVTPDEGKLSSAYPEFNFNIESISASDTIATGQTISFNLYLRQQLTYVKGRKYFVSFTIPQSYDGEGLIYKLPWRSDDLVLINYDQVVKDNYRVAFTYRPLHQNPGTYQVAFTCKDEAGRTRTYTKRLIVI